MDGPKLTRTQSSLLRSSPTVRSSIQSLSLNSITETTPFSPSPTSNSNSKHRKQHFSHNHHPYHPHSTLFPLIFLPLIFLFLFLSLKTDDLATSENLLLALSFIALTLFYLSKNKSLLKHFSFPLSHSLSSNKKHPRSSSSVQWYIGSDTEDNNNANNYHYEDKVVEIKEGVEVYSNGDFYEGEFFKGKCNGSGVYTYFVKGRYEGDWVEGRYDGYGIESWARGSRYRGQYKGGLRHGFGVYRFYTGDTYAGQWCNGQYHGVGAQTCSDGSCYVGVFKCGVKHGLGCYHFRNGDRYAGEYFGDKIHGFGVYHFANGHCYEGSWHEGRKQGYGMYTFRNGEAKCGEWDCGSLRTALPPLTDSVLRAVQAARKAAENAIHLRRVDDQVNKAVMAANRAATAARVAAVKAVQNRMDGSFHDMDV